MKPLESYYNFSSQVLKVFEEMKNTPQSLIHHGENFVYLHTQMVIDELNKTKESISTDLYNRLLYVSLFHDIAKPNTTVFEDDDWKSPGHAKLGESMFREFMWDEVSFREREEIAALIRFHGLPIFFNEKRDVDNYMIDASLRCNLSELAHFSQCDFKGRICSDLEECLFKIELFKEKAEELGCLNKPYEFRSDWARLHYFKKGGYHGVDIFEPEGDWVVVICGLAGAGKNTWVNNNWDGRIIELDSIRQELKIKPTDKKGQGTVAQAAKEKLRESLRKKEPVLWNATNITKMQRSAIIDLALEYRAKIKIVYVNCSLEKAIEQNLGRETGPPRKAIEKMARKFEMPTLKECHQLEITNE